MLRKRPERLYGPDSRRGLWTRGIRLASGFRSIDDGVQRMLSKAKGMRLSGGVATCVAAVFVLAFVQMAIAQDETPAKDPAPDASAATAGESPASGDKAAAGDMSTAETDSASPGPAANPDAPVENQSHSNDRDQHVRHRRRFRLIGSGSVGIGRRSRTGGIGLRS